ncbi:MAG TPA: LysE family translocator [Woeseiaceae bacterium]
MQELVPAWPVLATFCAASLVLAVTPGPGVLYIVTRSLAQGRAAGLASVLGIALGNFGNALGASLGLAALFAMSAVVFTVVKLAGAAYLIWLGVRAVMGGGSAPETTALPRSGTGRVVRDGFFVALLNPKTAMFFAAFLPQFMSPGAQPLAQAALLGGLFVAIAMASDTLYVLAARTLAPLVRGAGRTGRYLSGGVFIGLGLLTAFAGDRGR